MLIKKLKKQDLNNYDSLIRQVMSNGCPANQSRITQFYNFKSKLASLKVN
jgi:hypothetical protein